MMLLDRPKFFLLNFCITITLSACAGIIAVGVLVNYQVIYGKDLEIIRHELTSIKNLALIRNLSGSPNAACENQAGDLTGNLCGGNVILVEVSNPTNSSQADEIAVKLLEKLKAEITVGSSSYIVLDSDDDHFLFRANTKAD